MKPTPIFIIANRMKRLSLAHRIAHLRSLVQCEPPRSIRRAELEALLKREMTKQLRKECRAA